MEEQNNVEMHEEGGGGGLDGGVAATAEEEEDPLAPLPTFEHTHTPSPGLDHAHMKTYTAGEDSSRLAQAARELGLENMRKPRRQVRKSRGLHAGSYAHRLQQETHYVLSMLLDSAMEDARMFSVYSSHVSRDRVDDDEDGVLWSSLPEFTVEEDLFLEEEYEEYAEGGGDIDAHGHEVKGGSLTAAVLGIIKGMVGPAILYLPHGFASAGYIVALPIMVASTVLFLYSCTCLLESWRYCHDADEEQRVHQPNNETALLLENNQRQNSGTGTSKRQMLSYPELAYRGLGVQGESMVKTGIALMQSGVCLTYLIFVPQNLHTSFKIIFGWDLSPQFWLIVMIGLQIPLSWIRDIRKLTPTNLLANLLILYGLTTCLGFAFSKAIEGDGRPIQNLWKHYEDLAPFDKDWFLFIGTSVLLFEGSITLLVPLQEAVHTPENRKKFPVVYNRVILGIICFYAFFGTTCWMAFGKDVNVVLTTSLPSGVLATTVQLAYSIAVIFTFPLQNFPSLEIACRTIKSWALSSSSANKPFWTKRNVISSVLVTLLAVVALCTMDSLDKVVSLMGSLLGCPIAFVFPPLIHSSLVADISTARLLGNRTVAALGVVAMAMASITTLATW